MEALYKKIPTNMRIFGENLFGSTDPITQKDFTNDELVQIIALKKRARSHCFKRRQSRSSIIKYAIKF
jgi:hypothetical protein